MSFVKSIIVSCLEKNWPQLGQLSQMCAALCWLGFLEKGAAGNLDGRGLVENGLFQRDCILLRSKNFTTR